MFFKRKKKDYPCDHCKHFRELSHDLMWCSYTKNQIITKPETCDKAERMRV